MSETENLLEFQNLYIDSEHLEANVKLSGLEDCNNTEPTMTEKLEAESFKSVNLIGYEGPLLSENDFKKALVEGPKSIEYTKLINYLTNELRGVCNIDEHVNAILTPEDSVSFIMETSSFLNELGCPYTSLTQGHVTERLSTVLDRILLIQHLVGELMAARILKENRPDKKIELKLQESSQAADLRKILMTLGFPKPPANIAMQSLLQKLIPTIQNTVQKAGNDLLGNPIFSGTLSEKQWETLADVQQELHEDYLIRREMLLKRLDCTIQSFHWSDKTKGRDELFNKTYSEKRKLLKVEPEVDLSDLLASRDDLAIIEKTSSAAVRKNTKSAINKVIIGQVPDRGGRTSELAPPPPEMPPWQQRSSAPGGGFRGGGHQAQRGGTNYSRGTGQQGSYGGGNSFSQGGGNFSQGGGGNQRSFDSAGTYGGDSSRSDFSRGGGSNYSRGTSNYSRGGNEHSRGGNDNSRGGSDYNRGGGSSDYSRGAKDYSRGTSSYSQGSNNNTSRNNDYSGGGYTQSSGYSQGSGGYSQGGGNNPRNSGGYSQGAGGYSQGGGKDSRNSGSYSQGAGGYSQGGGNNSRNSGSYSQGGSSKGGFDSAGGYGGYSQDYQEPKRAKTYDQFQQNKTTYADQYVQESQHNQQYQSRDNRNRGSQGGRSNYNRGGGAGGGYR